MTGSKTTMVIYKTTNLINGKIYIGYDTKNDSNYYGSGRKYLLAKKKYGKENFRKAIIDSDEDFKALCLKEIFWIAFYDARNPAVGYNITKGGLGHCSPCSEEAKQKIGIANSGKNNGMYGKGHLISGEKHPMFGKHHSKESNKKNRDSHLGKVHSEEAKQKMKGTHTGTHFSKETRVKLKIINSGQNNPNSKTNREKRRLANENK